MVELVTALLFALVSVIGGNVADHDGSPAYQGVDVSYLDGRRLAVCDREPDGNNAKARAGDLNGHSMTVHDNDGFAGNCGVATGSHQWKWHATAEDGSGYAGKSWHLGDEAPDLAPNTPEGIPAGTPLVNDPNAIENGERLDE